MDDAEVKAAVDRFLKNISFSARRELEKVVRKAVSSGKLKGGENLTTAVTLANETLDLNVTIFSKIELH
jgi:hypothetical protein